LAFKASPWGQGTNWRCIPIIFLAVTAIFFVALFIGGRSKPQESN
jgi:hypothetical protein